MVHSIDSVSLYSRLQQDISKSQIELARINRQISSGRRLLSFSDDIGDSTKAYRYQNTLNKQNMFLSTIGEMRSRLEASDGILSEVDTLMLGLQQISIDMGDSGATREMRLAEAEVVSEDLEALVDLANTKIAGQYLFSGFDTRRDPFQYLGSEVIFHGDANEIKAQISEGQYLESTLNPSTAFGDLTVEQQGIDLNARLSFGDGNFKSQATAAGTTTTIVDSSLIGFTGTLVGLEVYTYAGTTTTTSSAGVTIGENATIVGFDSLTGTITVDAADAFSVATDATTEYSVSQGAPGTFLDDLEGGFNGGVIEITTTEFPTGVEVDLSSAETLSDVKKIIEDVSSRLSVTLTAAGDGIVVTDSALTSITIADVDSGTAATKLDIAGTNAGGVITGGDLNPKLTRETELTDLAGALNDPIVIGSIYLTQGSRTATVDLSSASTVGDMLDLIEDAEMTDGTKFYLDAYIDSDSEGIVIASRISGAEFSISNATSLDDTAEDLGLLTLTPTTLISSYRNGRGLDTASGDDFVITVAAVDYGIDLSNATDTQDILDAINAAVPGITASINNVAGNRIQLDHASNMTVSAGASNVAEQLGFQYGTAATTHQSSDVSALHVNSLFSAVSDLLVGLQNDDQSEIILSEDAIDARFDDLLHGRAKVGSRVERLDLTQNFLEAQSIYVTEDLVNTRDVNLTEAIADLQTLQVALQATLTTTGSILNLTLVNFL